MKERAARRILFASSVFFGSVMTACAPVGDYHSPLENLATERPDLVPPSMRDQSQPLLGATPQVPEQGANPDGTKAPNSSHPDSGGQRVLTIEDIKELNDYSYILQSVPISDPQGIDGPCLTTGEDYIPTNADSFIHTVVLGGNEYGPSGPVKAVDIKSRTTIAEWDPRTQPVPINTIGLPHGSIAICIKK